MLKLLTSRSMHHFLPLTLLCSWDTPDQEFSHPVRSGSIDVGSGPIRIWNRSTDIGSSQIRIQQDWLLWCALPYFDRLVRRL